MSAIKQQANKIAQRLQDSHRDIRQPSEILEHLRPCSEVVGKSSAMWEGHRKFFGKFG